MTATTNPDSASPALRAYAAESARRLSPAENNQMQPIFQQVENSRCDQCEQDRGRAFRLMTLDENIPRNQRRQNPGVDGELWWETLSAARSPNP